MKERTREEILDSARQMVADAQVQQEVIEQYFPELKESKDEKIRKEIIKLIKFYYGSTLLLKHTVSKEDMIVWLENLAPKPQGKLAQEAIKEKKIDNSIKITSKPKFKIGDWVTDGNSVFHITNIDYGFYQYEDGYSVISLIDARCHLWTIKDAKDGDILVSCVNNRPFIFKGLLDPDHPNCPVAYCGINDAYHFHISRTDWWWEDENVQPASKARRGFLFREMDKAGYKWDADKKELIKL